MATHLDNYVFTCSDSELAALIRESPRLEQHPGIVLLSNQYLAKSYDSTSAADAIDAVKLAHRLGIRVPRFVRLIRYEDMVFTIMERIEGHTLEDAWPSLGWCTSYHLALQLRQFILNMRSVTSTTAGSLATGDCRSFWLDDFFRLPAGAAPKDISAFLSFWIDFISIRQELKKGSHHLPLREPSGLQPNKLVFTHHDLAPRNVMLDTLGQMWLLDWDFAGFYPPYFEYASMNNFTMPREWGPCSRIRWYFLAWVAAGRFEKESRLLRMVRSKFLRFGAGRRCSIRAKATKSRPRRVSNSFKSSNSVTED